MHVALLRSYERDEYMAAQCPVSLLPSVQPPSAVPCSAVARDTVAVLFKLELKPQQTKGTSEVPSGTSHQRCCEQNITRWRARHARHCTRTFLWTHPTKNRKHKSVITTCCIRGDKKLAWPGNVRRRSTGTAGNRGLVLHDALQDVWQNTL